MSRKPFKEMLGELSDQGWEVERWSSKAVVMKHITGATMALHQTCQSRRWKANTRTVAKKRIKEAMQ